MRPAKFSIRKHLLIWLGCAITLVSFIQSIISYHVALHEVDGMSDAQMVATAHAVRHKIRNIGNIPQIEYSGISDDFELRFTPNIEHFEHPPGIPFAGVFSDVEKKSTSFRVFTLRTDLVRIEVWHANAARQRLARKLAMRTIAPIILLAPFLFLIVWWSTARSFRSLNASRKDIASRTPSDLQPMPLENVPSELLPFIEEINMLFARVDDAFSAQQSFVANAAHELRSPLAALRLQTQALQRASTESARIQVSERLLNGIDRATRLVEQMLVLAREEAAPHDNVSSDLLATLRIAIADILTHSQQRHQEIKATLPDALSEYMVLGSTEPLRILLRNLLDNASKYTPAGGTIHLSLQQEKNAVLLEIEDSGPGIAQADLPHIFNRFYRGPSQGIEGCGLGLSIVQCIANRYDIRIALDKSAQLGGLRVQLYFKAAPFADKAHSLGIK